MYICRSVEKCHDRFNVIFRSLFCGTCSHFIYVLEELPHIGHPYNITAWKITLTIKNLFEFLIIDFILTNFINQVRNVKF